MRSDILSNIAPKIPNTIATNYPKNAGVATTAPNASENRKTGGNLTFTNTTEQSAATNAQRFLNLDALSVVLPRFL
jgi:hypothetical protein